MFEKRFLQFDLLRGVAVLLILGRHLRWPYTLNLQIQLALVGWSRIGWVGVDLFFVLSGYLIASLLLKELGQTQKINFGRFFRHRFFKIEPSYLLLILVTVPVAPLLGYAVINSQSILGQVFDVQNYVGSPDPFFHTWSIAIEVHFYLLIAALFWILGRRQKNVQQSASFLWKLSLLLFFACLALRLQYSLNNDYQWQKNVSWTHFRLDTLFAGVAIACAQALWPMKMIYLCRQYRFHLLAAGILILAPACYYEVAEHFWMYTFGLTISALASSLILMSLTAFKIKAPSLLARSLGLVGRCSYNIYLWHILFSTSFEKYQLNLAEIHPTVPMLLNVFGSIGVGFLTTKFVEEPILRWAKPSAPVS